MIRSALMTVMTNAAIKAGRGLKRDFGEIGQLQVSMKGTGDFVSLADKRAEKTLYEELAKSGIACRKFVVASSGSMCQVWLLSVPSIRPPSSMTNP